jgi:hypothetical protein
VLTARRVEAVIGRNQALDGLATENVGIDDFIYVGRSHTSIPDRVGIDDNIWAMLTLVEASGFVGAHSMLQSALRKFLLKDPLQFTFAAGITTAAWVSFWPLIDADKDVLVELGHINNVADLES